MAKQRGVKVIYNERRVNRVLNKIPVMVQAAAYDSGLRPAAKVVEKRAKQLAPSSRESGSRNKWSASMKASRQNVKPLRESISTKVVRKPSGGGNPYAMAGPERPWGNIAHFISPLKKATREIVLWGRKAGRQGRKDNDFMKRAFDETKQAAARAFTRGVIRGVRAKLKDLVRA